MKIKEPGIKKLISAAAMLAVMETVTFAERAAENRTNTVKMEEKRDVKKH